MGMQWWQKALATISGVTLFSIGFTRYNQYYEDVCANYTLGLLLMS